MSASGITAHPLQEARGKPSHLSQTKTKGGVQSSFSHLKYHSLGTAGDHWAVIQAAQPFSQPLQGLGLPPGASMFSPHHYWSCGFQSQKNPRWHQPLHLPGGSEHVPYFPCCHSDLLGGCACLPLVPPPAWYVKGLGGLFHHPVILLALPTLIEVLPSVIIFLRGEESATRSRMLQTGVECSQGASLVTWPLQPVHCLGRLAAPPAPCPYLHIIVLGFFVNFIMKRLKYRHNHCHFEV